MDTVEQNVNAHDHSIRAAARARANGKLQGIIDAAHVAPDPWWQRWFRWETLTVAGKTIEKGWVVPQPLGIALLVVILGFGGTAVWRVSDAISKLTDKQASDTQEVRVLLNRLDERSIQDDKYRREKNQEIQQQIEGVKSHQAAIESVMNKQFAELKARTP